MGSSPNYYPFLKNSAYKGFSKDLLFIIYRSFDKKKNKNILKDII